MRFILLGALFLLSHTAYAMEAFECSKELSKAQQEEAFSNLQKRYETLSDFKANFVQESYLAALDQSQLSQGRVKFLKPSKMRWDYSSPEIQHFILEGNKVTFYQPELRQALIQEVSEVLISEMPVLFLSGVGKLGESFSLKSGCETSEGILLNVIPKRDKKDDRLQQVSLLINKNNHLPIGGEVIDIGGNKTAILFGSLNANTRTLSQKDFEVNLPAGTDVQGEELISPTERKNVSPLMERDL